MPVCVLQVDGFSVLVRVSSSVFLCLRAPSKILAWGLAKAGLPLSLSFIAHKPYGINNISFCYILPSWLYCFVLLRLVPPTFLFDSVLACLAPCCLLWFVLLCYTLVYFTWTSGRKTSMWGCILRVICCWLNFASSSPNRFLCPLLCRACLFLGRSSRRGLVWTDVLQLRCTAT